MNEHGALRRLRDAVIRYNVAIARAPRNYVEAEATAAFEELEAAIKDADAILNEGPRPPEVSDE